MDKRRKAIMKKLLLTLLSLCLVGCMFNASKQRTEKYIFPITTDDEIWKTLNQNEKIEETQIPDDILSALTSESLLETILDYPLISNLFSYSTMELGFEKVSEQFNGINEFRQREDAGKVVLEKLSKMIEDENRDELDFMVLSFLLQQAEIKSQIEEDEFKKVEKELAQFYS